MPRVRQCVVFSLPGPKCRVRLANGPSTTQPLNLDGIVGTICGTLLTLAGMVYVPGTPSPPKPVTGSKIGEPLILRAKEDVNVGFEGGK